MSSDERYLSRMTTEEFVRGQDDRFVQDIAYILMSGRPDKDMVRAILDKHNEYDVELLEYMINSKIVKEMEGKEDIENESERTE